MTSTEDMIIAIAGILKNGMVLGKMSDDERKGYEASLIEHVSTSPYYSAFYDHDTKTVMIETTYFDPLLCVDISEDSIYFLPLTENGYYSAFMKVIEFVMLDRKKKKADLEKQLEEKKEIKEKPNFDFL